MEKARPICRRLLWHVVLSDAARARANTGNSSAASTAMMAITTSNSTSVKPGSLLATYLTTSLPTHAPAPTICRPKTISTTPKIFFSVSLEMCWASGTPIT